MSRKIEEGAGSSTAEKAKAEQLPLEYVVKYRKGSEADQFISEFYV